MPRTLEEFIRRGGALIALALVVAGACARSAPQAGAHDEAGHTVNITDVFTSSAGTIWRCEAQPAALRRSEDGGMTWELVFENSRTTGFFDFQSIHSRSLDSPSLDVSSGEASAVTMVLLDLDGGVWRSTTEGRTWERGAARLGEGLRAAAWQDSLGIAVGIRGTVFLSRDAGATWSAHPPQDESEWLGVALHGQRAWIVAAGGTVLTAPIPEPVEAPLSWTRQTSNTEETLFDVAFADEDHGFCVGRAGTVLQTVDGGQTWRGVTVPGTTSWRAVAMPSEDEVFLAGEGGSVCFTDDAGATWQTLPTESTRTWNALAFPSATRLILVGDDLQTEILRRP